MNISILTATYNHPSNLEVLYNSLKNQSDRNFVWIIVDDGSREDTNTNVLKFTSENIIRIEYIYQHNSGKSAAINRGIDLADSINSDFILIVDDDEDLNNDAISKVKTYYNNYKGKCSCINFNRADLSGNPLTNGQEINEFLMSFQKHKSLRLHADGYVGYFMNSIRNIRFPLYEGEKYIGPSVLMMLASTKLTILWAAEVLGKTEYLEGGITKQGRKLRVRNPKGMIFHASLMMHPDSSIRTKIGYSTYAYAYMYYAGLSKAELKNSGIDMSVFFPMKVTGRFLALYWKYKLS